MQNILKFISEIPERELRKNQLILLDYDGTLTPIAGKPPLARLQRSKTLELKKMSKMPGVEIGIVTGRGIKDIRKLLGVKGIIISANHGFEVYHKGKMFYPLGKKFVRPMNLLGIRLNRCLNHIPRLFLESKGFSVAVHYRLVPKKFWGEIERVIRKVSAPWRRRYGWRMTAGKKVWEVRPSYHWNKGDVAIWIWKKFAAKATPWYFGDDLTDEDAFRALKKAGITVTVGRHDLKAKYFVKNVSEVWRALDLYIRRRKGEIC